MKNTIEIGKVINTHSLKGEIKVAPWCDDISVFNTMPSIYIGENEYKIEKARLHKQNFIIKLFGVDKIDDAEDLKNLIVFANRDYMPELGDNIFYIKDLIGISVVLEDGEAFGTLTDCFSTGANDVYVVKTKSGSEVLLPAISQVVKKIDIEKKCMTVKLMEGLIFDED